MTDQILSGSKDFLVACVPNPHHFLAGVTKEHNMKPLQTLHFGHICIATCAAIVITAAWQPNVVQAKERLRENRSAVAKGMAAALYSIDANGFEDTMPCRVDDDSFMSMDYGCRDMQTGLIWSASRYRNAFDLGWNSYTSWTFWSELVQGTKKKAGIVYGGYQWRLPSRTELVQLSQNDNEDADAPFEMTHVRATAAPQTWSGTKAPGGAPAGVHYWTVRLSDGNQESFSKGSTFDAIAVRR